MGSKNLQRSYFLKGTHCYNFVHILSYIKIQVLYICETKMGFLHNTQFSEVLKYQNTDLTLIKILIFQNRMKWQNAFPKTCSYIHNFS